MEYLMDKDTTTNHRLWKIERFCVGDIDGRRVSNNVCGLEMVMSQLSPSPSEIMTS
jgi:hypothetical protein